LVKRKLEGVVVVFAHDERAYGGGLGFVVLVGDAVVADEGIGHHHRLIGVGRVGDDLLIAHHGGVEHHLAHPVLAPAEGRAVDIPLPSSRTSFLFIFFAIPLLLSPP
jgi:hypothetical protein